MSAQSTTTLLELFRRMEARLEREPENVQGEIASGVYLMSPRPRGRHGACQGTTPIALVPEWVAEVLSPTTEANGRTEKASPVPVDSVFV